MMRLNWWPTPLETAVPSTVIDVVSMLKAVMLGAAFIKTSAIAVLLGTDVKSNCRFAVLMMEPLLNEITVKA